MWDHFSHLQNLRNQFWHRLTQPNAAMRTMTFFKTWFLTLVSVVQSLSVRPFFASTESQEYNSDIVSHNITRNCAQGPILRHDLFIWSKWLYLTIWYDFFYVWKLRNPILASDSATKRGIAHNDPFSTWFFSLTSEVIYGHVIWLCMCRSSKIRFRLGTSCVVSIVHWIIL